MKFCGACERELSRDSFSGTQWRLRKSLRRCKGCVTVGKELVLFTKGRERSADDECPICNLPLPLDSEEKFLYTCCMKEVCHGCVLKANQNGMFYHCPFCRKPPPDSTEEELRRIEERVKAGDSLAILFIAICYKTGEYGFETDTKKAIEMFGQAAELGLTEAHFELAIIFDENAHDMGIAKDIARALEHYEEAAKHGDSRARCNLGAISYRLGNFGHALKHWKIAAKLGSMSALKKVKELTDEGIASDSDYVETLRGYHEVVEGMTSPEREKARACLKEDELSRFPNKI